ncbi:E3 ubiquitin-protein ligase BRE1B isoform X2 [Xenopus tropicalis]|uniref:E3 ubiquitin protein ligase n=1 Tax=Xenopus tropicalis TaxID=8364 RepID=A0A8J0R3D2_XENTR|nr:E3 ubiquitin-protein ligase BRE1B isoform X2 [Xenopus tropicalis]|eukprot:XP_004918162.1 PREDICTED: E3 ubiquitin-protein ligase BRE1B isoform X2 [Xenopus tropicalis]
MSGAGSKRASSDNGSGPSEKKPNLEAKTPTTLIEPIRLGGISSTEEMDMKVLQFKNKKLAERLEQRQGFEDELREKIEKLEKRQATDDATLLIVNRYWSKLDEDVHVLLKRYDSEPSKQSAAPSAATEEPESAKETAMETDESAEGSQPPPTQEIKASPEPPPAPPFSTGALPESSLTFLATLAHCTKEEIELKLQERMEFSKKAVSCVLETSNKLHCRTEELCDRIHKGDFDHLGESPKKLNKELITENRRLQDLATVLQEKHHRLSLQHHELQDRATSTETKVSEMERTIEDLQWDIEKLRKHEQKLNRHLAEALEQLNSGYHISGSSGSFQGGQTTLSMQKFEMLNAELDQNQELANSRISELEKLQNELQAAVRLKEKLKLDLRTLPEEAVRNTQDFRCLQSQFSLLYNESLQVKTQLDEARALLLSTKNSHLRQIERMESEELSVQKKLRTEVIQLEDTLAQVRKEYEMLRIEFEQNLAANEQAGPINREMRHLIGSLQNHNHQLKGDVQRYKRKVRDSQAEVSKLRFQIGGPPCPQPGSSGSEPTTPVTVKEEEVEVKKEPLAVVPREPETPTTPEVKKEEEEQKKEAAERTKAREREAERERDKDRERDKEKEREREKDKQKTDESKRKDCDILKQLRAELKKAQESQKEMKLLLDMYKSAPKEQRDKVQLMAAERKTKAEMEEQRTRVQALEEKDKRERKKLADEEALRKIKMAEEQIDHLQRKLTATKQEEEALLSEMDVTGQAFEDMQEQNIRLMQQLREKDDANFKLMSERIKSNQIHKLLREEKEELAEQVQGLKAQVDAQLLQVQKLEERERLLHTSLTSIEKEVTLRTQSLELNKRKAVEAAQLAEDLKVQMEHVGETLRDTQNFVCENRSAKEKESFSLKRAQEDVSRLRRKLEKQKKMEVYADADQILQEEIKEYRARLTCPCCNTRKKDAVLTKCFHVFCFECVKTRYESRQRKCPKCNAAFGAHDFHRIYIN